MTQPRHTEGATEAEREAFEAWISAAMPDVLPLARNFDDYQRVGTQMAWRAWQAHASATEADVHAAFCRGLIATLTPPSPNQGAES